MRRRPCWRKAELSACSSARAQCLTAGYQASQHDEDAATEAESECVSTELDEDDDVSEVACAPTQLDATQVPIEVVRCSWARNPWPEPSLR